MIIRQVFFRPTPKIADNNDTHQVDNTANDNSTNHTLTLSDDSNGQRLSIS